MTKKQGLNKIIKSIPLAMVVVFAITITFVNEIAEHLPKKYDIHKKTYSPIIKERNKQLEKLVTGTPLEKEYHIIIKRTKVKLQKYTKIKNEILDETSILGYISPKNMLFAIGLPISGLILALLFYGFVVKSNEDVLKKKLYLRIINPFILTFSYWMVWSLLWFKIDGEYDIPNYILYPIFLVISVLILIISKYLINYNKSIEERLKNGIKLLINHISIYTFSVIPEKKKKEVFIKNLETYEKLAKTVRK